MKKFLMISLILTGLIFPLACGTNNSGPTTGPLSGVGGGSTNSAPSNTPTGTVFPGTPTKTNTPSSGTFTATYTPTFSIPTPVYLNNYGTSAAPNGACYLSPILYVAEGEFRVNGDVTMFEEYGLGGGQLNGGPIGNLMEIGVPTPDETPYWTGVTVQAVLPQGYTFTNGFWVLLDSSASGAASLYEGCNGFNLWAVPAGASEYPTNTTSYGGSLLNNPHSVCSDNNGNVYVADTGNGYVDEFSTGCADGPYISPNWLHRWNGSAPATLFKQPWAVACDSTGNVYVGDAGYTPSLIQEYKSGGTTVINQFFTITGCVVHGMTIDQNDNIYVSDDGVFPQVEEYAGGKVPAVPFGTLLRVCPDPHSPHEFLPYAPSFIALAYNGANLQNIIVGDTNNDLINVFGP
jgi:hypothetical protein